jgi:hypothetical protein
MFALTLYNCPLSKPKNKAIGERTDGKNKKRSDLSRDLRVPNVENVGFGRKDIKLCPDD